jgi:hypothetical protein
VLELVTRWSSRLLVACRASVRGEDQESMVGSEVKSLWWRTSAARRWATEGRVQYLNSVAMD